MYFDYVIQYVKSAHQKFHLPNETYEIEVTV